MTAAASSPTASHLPVLFRAPKESDFACITDNWLRSNRSAPPHAVMFEDVYWRHVKPQVEQRVRRVHLLIATTPEDRDQICGWVAFSPAPAFRLHYVYVKKDLRGFGLAQHMVRHVRPEFGDVETCVTSVCAPHADEWTEAGRDGGALATHALREPLVPTTMLEALKYYATPQTWRRLRSRTRTGRVVPRWGELVQRWALRYEPF